MEVDEESSVSELLRTVVGPKLMAHGSGTCRCACKGEGCVWLTEWLKSENTYGPNPEAGRIIDENIDAMKAFANKGGRSQAPTIILSGPGIVWHGTSMQNIATTFFRKCRDAGFPAYPSNAMWFGCSKKSSNGGVVGIERGGHQFMGLVSAFTDLTSILRREYALNGEIQETLAMPINYLIDEGKLVNPPESYFSAVKPCGGKTCGGKTCLTPVQRWSTSEDTPWAEVISAPRTMSGGQGAQARPASANAPRAASARNSDPQSAPSSNAGSWQQTMAQRVRSSTPPATGKQRLGQAMADFGQSAANRGLSPAICGKQRGSIPAKPTPACGYTPSTTGAPTKTGGQRVALKLNTGKQIFVAKPKPAELPKDAYSDDFPTLSGREAANRWGGGTAKRAGGVPPNKGRTGTSSVLAHWPCAKERSSG